MHSAAKAQRRKEQAQHHEKVQRSKEEAQHREEEAQPREEERERREEDAWSFEALLKSVSLQHSPSPPQNKPFQKQRWQPQQSPANVPQPLTSNVTFRRFREWRRRWEDYATLLDLSSMPQRKQLAHLRVCLSSDTLSILEDNLRIFGDSLHTVDEALDLLQEYLEARNSEAIHQRAFSACKQAKEG